jgi:hypothetical protein
MERAYSALTSECRGTSPIRVPVRLLVPRHSNNTLEVRTEYERSIPVRGKEEEESNTEVRRLYLNTARIFECPIESDALPSDTF